MASDFNGLPPSTTFPDHAACFGDPSNTSDICRITTQTMIDFLNFTAPTSTPETYLDIYCLNPPSDSCSFGYCPNPDVASPAVRFSMYFTSVVSAILVLYSPEDIKESFFAQLLNVYSLVVAAVISIANNNLTKMHSIIALTLAASPLSLYLMVYVLRTLLGKSTRLDVVFGRGNWINRTLVLIMLPLWISVLVFTVLPHKSWKFQQAACDTTVGENHIALMFFIPFIVFFAAFPEVGVLLIGSLLLAWAVAIYLSRKKIWEKHNKKLPVGRMWRQVVNRYPFIQFCTVILFPHLFWMFNIEEGLFIVAARESFSPTYGQLLAIFVTVMPFIQFCTLLPRVYRWFIDLSWVRLITCRPQKPYLGRQDTDMELPMQSTEPSVPRKSLDGFHGEVATPLLHMVQLNKTGSATVSRSASYDDK